MDCLLRAGQIEADLQGEGGESGECQSHKEALGAAFRACRIFGADKTEGPFFSQASLGLRAGHVGSTLVGENERVLNKNTFPKYKTGTMTCITTE